MGTTNTLPPPLSSACESSHPVELWILVNGEIVQCAGTFLPADEKGRPQLTAALPEGFVGVMRTGAAVRGFFTDLDGSVHTFLSSIHDWAPFRDRPSAARVVLEVPSLVAPCQRRRGDRKHLNSPVVRLAVTIRGQREVVPGRLVDASHSGLGVRTIRSHRNSLLQASDWTQISDYDLGADRPDWAVYRQALRDVPSQANPFAIDWPQQPSTD